MAKKKDNIWVYLGIGMFTMFLIIIWWLFKGTYATLAIMMLTWLVILLVIYIYHYAKRKKEEIEEYKPEKVKLLDESQATNLLDLKVQAKGLTPTKVSSYRPYNIQPSDPEKKPTQYFIRVFQDYHNDRHYLQFINRENADIGFKSSEVRFSDDEIRRILSEGAESTKEYTPVVKTYVDIEGKQVVERSYISPRQPKIVKKDEVIEEG